MYIVSALEGIRQQVLGICPNVLVSIEPADGLALRGDSCVGMTLDRLRYQ